MRPRDDNAVPTGLTFASGIDLMRPPHEAIDEGAGDVIEHRPEHFFQHLAGKLIVQAELDLASGIAQGNETPVTIEATKWSLTQADMHAVRHLLGIFSGEMGLDAVIADVDARRSDLGIAFDQLGSATPGQKLRIVLDAVDELEHLRRRTRDEDGFFDDGHSSGIVGLCRPLGVRTGLA